MIAAAIAATAFAPPSPHPSPEARSAAADLLADKETSGQRRFARARHQIIREGHAGVGSARALSSSGDSCEQPPGRAALARIPPTIWPSSQAHRIDGTADIVGDEIAFDYHRAGVAIDRDHRHHAHHTDRSCGWRETSPPRIGRARGVAGSRSARAHARHRRARWKVRPPRRRGQCDHQQYRAHRPAPAHFRRRSRSLSPAPWRPRSRVASPVITVTREANAPRPCAMRSVCPWTTRNTSCSLTPSTSPQICAMTVSTPWPTDAAPVTTSTAPLVLRLHVHLIEWTNPTSRQRRRQAQRTNKFAGATPRVPSRCRDASTGSLRARGRAVRVHVAEVQHDPRCRACRATGGTASRKRRSDCAAAPRSDQYQAALRLHANAFAHERALEAARRPIGPAWRFVGEANVADSPIGRHPIGAGQHGGGEYRRSRASVART